MGGFLGIYRAPLHQLIDKGVLIFGHLGLIPFSGGGPIWSSKDKKGSLTLENFYINAEV